ncbi:hypothetical protein E2C01_020246 [Portunus trituberculatus]|uniref:Uncharacterized protein n=1 Tax=Portunus trituberculatus TaxID=210409 RepID=A0A5B7E109_PORTR|nr:hypothetical protein [Portunus trituberculatus]
MDIRIQSSASCLAAVIPNTAMMVLCGARRSMAVLCLAAVFSLNDATVSASTAPTDTRRTIYLPLTDALSYEQIVKEGFKELILPCAWSPRQGIGSRSFFSSVASNFTSSRPLTAPHTRQGVAISRSVSTIHQMVPSPVP